MTPRGPAWDVGLRDDGAATAAFGTVLMVGIAVLLAGLVAVGGYAYLDDRPDSIAASFHAETTPRGIVLTHAGGEDVPVAGTRILVEADGAPRVERPLGNVLSGATWSAGTSICVVGPDGTCAAPPSGPARVTIARAEQTLFARTLG